MSYLEIVYLFYRHLHMLSGTYQLIDNVVARARATHSSCVPCKAVRFVIYLTVFFEENI